MDHESQPNGYQVYREKIHLAAGVEGEKLPNVPIAVRSESGRWRLSATGRAEAARIADSLLPQETNGNWSEVRSGVTTRLDEMVNRPDLSEEESAFVRLTRRSVENRLRFLDTAVGLDTIRASGGPLEEIVTQVEEAFPRLGRNQALKNTVKSIQEYQGERNRVMRESGVGGDMEVEVTCDMQAARAAEVFVKAVVDPDDLKFSLGYTKDLIKKATEWNRLQEGISYDDQLREWVCNSEEAAVPVQEVGEKEIAQVLAALPEVSQKEKGKAKKFLEKNWKLIVRVAGVALIVYGGWLGLKQSGIVNAKEIVDTTKPLATAPPSVPLEQLGPTSTTSVTPYSGYGGGSYVSESAGKHASEETAEPADKIKLPEAKIFELGGVDLTHNFTLQFGSHVHNAEVLPQTERAEFAQWWKILFKDPQGMLATKDIKKIFDRLQAGPMYEKYKDLFENWRINAESFTGTAAETGGRTAVFCHSGVGDFREWPCNFIRGLSDKDINTTIGHVKQTDKFGNEIWVPVKLVKITRISAKQQSDAVGTPDDENIPARIDLAKIGLQELEDQPGIDVFACGDESQVLDGMRTVASFKMMTDAEADQEMHVR
jgi:hypothetical protein